MTTSKELPVFMVDSHKKPSYNNSTLSNNYAIDRITKILKYSSGTCLDSGKSREHEILSNGFTRQYFRKAGFTDFEIECWGLDQPKAPEPWAAGLLIADMMDGDLDGDINFPFY